MCWYGIVLRSQDDLVLSRVSMFEVKGQRNKGSQKRTWKKPVKDEGSKGWSEQGRCTSPINVDCLR